MLCFVLKNTGTFLLFLQGCNRPITTGQPGHRKGTFSPLLYKGTVFFVVFAFYKSTWVKPHMLAKGDPLHSLAGGMLAREAGEAD